ncbi:MAG: plasmid partitioning protein RepB [Cognatishimia sp.]|uniref:plasmid partitioning protein RepB n=1 Tax=Cognatishimia sp. TaxID=2211648 RepID=UPI003B8BEA15
MSNSKKKRLSMLDSISAAGGASPVPTTPMMSSNRALRSARDAVDAHKVWELDPADVIDDRPADRLDPADVLDLRDAIETNGQTVPILVRRHPSEAEKYLLVYGRRRLEAIKQSDKVDTVRALVASMDDQSAVRAQISENMARRDLSFIEKALFAQELVNSGFGNQTTVAEVLTVPKSAISMALSVIDSVGTPLVRAIGAAHGIGRPRWEALAKNMRGNPVDNDKLVSLADDVHVAAEVQLAKSATMADPNETSVAAFAAVEAYLEAGVKATTAPALPKTGKTKSLNIGGKRGGTLKRTKAGLALTLNDGPFSDWVESEAQDLVEELHARWIRRNED